MFRLRSNCRVTEVLPSVLVELTVLRPAIVENCRSSGVATDEERRWEFRPENPWTLGRHRLVVETTLEDLAGNRIGQPFEVDEIGQVDRRPSGATVDVPFEIRP